MLITQFKSNGLGSISFQERFPKHQISGE